MTDYRSPLLYDARKIAAARELCAAHGTVRVRPITGTYPMTSSLTLPSAGPGLGCNCQYTGGGMKGYRAAFLDGIHKTRLNGLAQSRPEGTPALIPVSDRAAVTAAVRMFKGLRP